MVKDINNRPPESEPQEPQESVMSPEQKYTETNFIAGVEARRQLMITSLQAELSATPPPMNGEKHILKGR